TERNTGMAPSLRIRTRPGPAVPHGSASGATRSANGGGPPCGRVGGCGKIVHVTTATTTGRAKLDQACAAALDVARDGLDVDGIGAHLEAVPAGERLVTHLFECTLPGYRGWRWAVTVARAPRSKRVTVCETVLLPGADALLAPVWVPWQERLQPGDLGV